MFGELMCSSCIQDEVSMLVCTSLSPITYTCRDCIKVQQELMLEELHCKETISYSPSYAQIVTHRQKWYIVISDASLRIKLLFGDKPTSKVYHSICIALLSDLMATYGDGHMRTRTLQPSKRS